jgi:hypothetical protein
MIFFYFLCSLQKLVLIYLFSSSDVVSAFHTRSFLPDIWLIPSNMFVFKSMNNKKKCEQTGAMRVGSVSKKDD